MKRHHFSGGPATHGSMFHRQPGSIGSSSFPSRVFKNKRLPGHMGAERVTVKGVQVVEIREDENLLFLCGAIPGPTGAIVEIWRAGTGGGRS
jgi:large subunit ribosomal protein L3